MFEGLSISLKFDNNYNIKKMKFPIFFKIAFVIVVFVNAASCQLFETISASGKKPKFLFRSLDVGAKNLSSNGSKTLNANSFNMDEITHNLRYNDTLLSSVENVDANLDHIGSKNMKQLKRYSKFTKGLIKKEKSNINQLMHIWDDIHDSTKRIGNVVAMNFPRMNLTEESFADYNTLANKLLDIKKLIAQQGKKIIQMNRNLTNYVRSVLISRTNSLIPERKTNL
jgi:hypothetical protein